MPMSTTSAMSAMSLDSSKHARTNTAQGCLIPQIKMHDLLMWQ